MTSCPKFKLCGQSKSGFLEYGGVKYPRNSSNLEPEMVTTQHLAHNYQNNENYSIDDGICEGNSDCSWHLRRLLTDNWSAYPPTCF